MNCVFAQIFFLAKNDGGEGWAQLLVFVVMAVIYGLAALAKSRGNKDVDFDEEEDREIERSFARSQQKLKQQQGGDMAAKTEPLWEPFELEEMQRQQLFRDTQAKELEPEISETVSTAVTDEGAGVEYEEDTEAEILNILNFDGGEDLQKAILYHEILGRPVSMRKSPAEL